MHRGGDRSGGSSSGGDRSGARFQRGPSRWSGSGGGGGGLGGSPPHRYSSRGASDGCGGGGRFHPYRGSSDYSSGGGVYRGGGRGGNDFGEQMNRYGGGNRGGGRGDFQGSFQNFVVLLDAMWLLRLCQPKMENLSLVKHSYSVLVLIERPVCDLWLLMQIQSTSSGVGSYLIELSQAGFRCLIWSYLHVLWWKPPSLLNRRAP